MARNAVCIGTLPHSKCGNVISHDMISAGIAASFPIWARGNRPACLCPDCLRRYREVVEQGSTRSYSWENTNPRGKKSRVGLTASIELEVMRPSKKAYAELSYNDFLITGDGTVDAEFKSPIYYGLQPMSKYAATVQRLIDTDNICIDAHCGTHTHFGVEDKIDAETMYDFFRIPQIYEALVRPMEETLRINPDDTRRLFGRYFGGWASRACYREPETHVNWINVQHNPTIEWRLPRFKSTRQFRFLIRVLSDITLVFAEAAKPDFGSDFYGRAKIENAVRAGEIAASKMKEALLNQFSEF